MRTPVAYYLMLSGILFMLGTVGVLTRKNALLIFMSVELQLNAVNLALVAFSSDTPCLCCHLLRSVRVLLLDHVLDLVRVDARTRHQLRVVAAQWAGWVSL